MLLAADLIGAFEGFDLETTPSGSEIEVVVRLQNAGDVEADDRVNVDFYLISTDNFDPEEMTNIFLGREQMRGDLPPGGMGFTDEFELPIGVNVPAGNYRFAVVVDPDNAVAEDDEDNNAATTDPFAVTQPDYDLVPSIDGTKTTLPEGDVVVGLGDDGTVRVVVTNPAESTATVPSGLKVDVKLFARPVGAMDDSEDVEITAKPTTISVSSLDPGESKTLSVKVEFPPDMETGEYEIIVKIDGDGALAETDEMNNEAALDDVTVMVADPFIDLAAGIGANIKLPDETIVSGDGTKIKIPVEITNLGNVPTQSGQQIEVTVSAVLLEDMDGAVGGGAHDGHGEDEDIHFEPVLVKVSKLGVGKIKKQSITVTLPPGVEAGMYEFRVDVDSSNLLDEPNELNNSAATGPVDVELGVVDLTAMISPKADLPTDFVNGSDDDFSVPVIITNEGNVPVPSGQTISVQLLARPVGGGMDILLGTYENQSISGLKPGKTKTLTLKNVLFPEDELGEFNIVAVVDSGEDLNESDEDNNEAVSDAFDPILVADPFVDLRVAIGAKIKLPDEPVESGDAVKIKVPIEILNDGNVAVAKGQKIMVTVEGELAMMLGAGGGAGDIENPLLVMDEVSISSLKPDKIKKATLTVEIVDGVPGGTYQFTATIDTTGLVEESDEMNNTATTNTFEVLHAFDLGVEIDDTVDLPGTATAGDGTMYEIPIVITNHGVMPMPADAMLDITVLIGDGAGVEAGTAMVSVSNLAPGASVMATLEGIVIPEGVEGDFPFRVVLNPGEDFDDTNDANDQAATESITISSMNELDLAIAFGDVDLPAMLLSGDGTMLELPIVITNTGDLAIPAGAMVDVEIRTGMDFDTVVGMATVDVGDLAVDDNVMVTVMNVVIPEGVVGDFQFRAVLLPSEDFEDSLVDNDADNTEDTYEFIAAVHDLAVTIDEPVDLPTLLLSGDGTTLSLPVTIENTGDLPIPAGAMVEVKVLVGDGDGVEAGSALVDVGDLALGGTVMATIMDIEIPEGVSGEQALRVVLQPSMDFDDADAGNDTDATDDTMQLFDDFFTMLTFDVTPTNLTTDGTRTGSDPIDGDANGELIIDVGGVIDPQEFLFDYRAENTADSMGYEEHVLFFNYDGDTAFVYRHLTIFNGQTIDVRPDDGADQLLLGDEPVIPVGGSVMDTAPMEGLFLTLDVEGTPVNEEVLDLDGTSTVEVAFVGYQTVERSDMVMVDTAVFTITLTHAATGNVDMGGMIRAVDVMFTSEITLWVDVDGIVQYTSDNQISGTVQDVGMFAENSMQTMQVVFA